MVLSAGVPLCSGVLPAVKQANSENERGDGDHGLCSTVNVIAIAQTLAQSVSQRMIVRVQLQ